MDKIDKQAIDELRRTDPFYMPYSDDVILENWGGSLSFCKLRLSLELQNLIDSSFVGRFARWIHNKLMGGK